MQPMKKWTATSLLCTFIYLLFLQMEEITGVIALLLLLVFCAEFIAQLVLAGLTRPVGINLKYFLIVLFRATSFLFLPLFSSPFRIIVIFFICILLYQQTKLPINPTFQKPLSKTEPAAAHTFYQAVFTSSCCMAALYSENLNYCVLFFILSICPIVKANPSPKRRLFYTEIICTGMICALQYQEILSDTTLFFIKLSISIFIAIISISLIKRKLDGE